MEAQTEQASTATESAPTTASTEATSTAPVESAASASSQPEASAEGTDGKAVVAAPAYTPNYKIKVMDKELEIPEKWRAHIKDAETEKEARELFEKAYGLDEVKKSRDTVREEYKTFKSQAEPVLQVVQQATPLYQQGLKALEEGNHIAGVYKMTEAFKLLGINKKTLQQYVYADLKMDELPPEQKASYNRERELELRAQQAQEQVSQLQNMYQQTAVQQRQFELNQVMSRSDVTPLVQSFDQRNGPGSFFNEVVRRGQWYAQTQNRDLPPSEIVQEIIKTYGLQAPSASPTQSQVVTQGNVPVIPAVKGGTSSPAHKSVRSLADLEKIAAEKSGY